MVRDSLPSRRTFVKIAGTGMLASTAGCASNPGSGDSSGSASDGKSGGSTSGENELLHLPAKTLTSLDPHKVADDFDVVTTVNHYDGLTYVGDDGKPIPNLATDWTITNEGRTWEFTIRDDVTTHAGNQLSASDVVYSAERWQALGMGYSGLWEGIVDSVEAASETKVLFHLTEPYSQFLATTIQFFIVDEEDVEANADDEWGEDYLQNTVAGTGPYTLREYRPGEEIIHDKFEEYWGGWEDNQFAVARAQITLESSTQRQMMKAGQADISDPWMAPSDYEDMASSSNVNVPGYGDDPQIIDNVLFCSPMNCQKAPTDDINVRKAISYAFDYESAVPILGGEKATGPVPKNMPGHNPNIKPYSQDLQKAEDALSAAEYSLEEINSGDHKIVYPEGSAGQRRVASLIAENISEIGIDWSVQGVPWANFVESTAKAETSPTMCTFFQSADLPSPEAFTYLMFHPESHGNWLAASWFDSDQVNQLLAEARAATDQETALEKSKVAQEHIVSGFPMLFISYTPFRVATNSNLGKFTHRGYSGFNRRYYDFTRTGDGRAK